MIVPADVRQWIAHSEEELRLRRCGYWISLRGARPTEQSKVRITIPRQQVFEVASLTAMMERVGARGLP